MAKHPNLSSLFTAIADAIRAKKGLAAGTKIVADNFPDEIAGITTGITPSGKIDITTNGEHDVTNYAKANVNVSSTIPSNYADVSGVTATKADVLSTVKFVDKNGTLDFGSIPKKTNSNLTASGKTVTGPAGYYANAISKSIADGALNSTMTFDVDDSTGIVTATASVKTSGYLASGKSTSDTEQLDTNSGGTWTPSATTARSIAKGTFLTGKLTLANEPNLIASNIKKGVSIYGVSGTYEVSSGITSSSNGIVYYHDSYAKAAREDDGFRFYLTVPVSGLSNVKVLHLSIVKRTLTANGEILSFDYDIYSKNLRVVYEDNSGDLKRLTFPSDEWDAEEVYVDEYHNAYGEVVITVGTNLTGWFEDFIIGSFNQDEYIIDVVLGEVDILD